MKYWCHNGEGDSVAVYSEDEIIDEYWEIWSTAMIKKYGKEEFEKTWSRQDCIDDWVVVNWAWESSTNGDDND